MCFQKSLSHHPPITKLRRDFRVCDRWMLKFGCHRSHTLSHPVTPCHTHPVTPCHTLSHTLSHPHTHPVTPGHTLSHPHTPRYPHTHTLSHPVTHPVTPGQQPQMPVLPLEAELGGTRCPSSAQPRGRRGDWKESRQQPGP